MEYPKIETLFNRDEKTHKVYPDQLRNPVYGIIKEWEWTEKIDGTNIRAMWDGSAVRFGGRTEAAQIPAKLFMWLQEHITSESMRLAFGETPAIVYGEGYGAGIQKGGGNYSPHQQMIVFDVLVEGKWWLSMPNVKDVAAKLNLDVVPEVGCMTLDQAVAMVRGGFNSPEALRKCGVTFRAEGLVGRTIEPLFDKHGHRLIVKVKTRDF